MRLYYLLLAIYVTCSLCFMFAPEQAHALLCPLASETKMNKLAQMWMFSQGVTQFALCFCLFLNEIRPTPNGKLAKIFTHVLGGLLCVYLYSNSPNPMMFVWTGVHVVVVLSEIFGTK